MYTIPSTLVSVAPSCEPISTLECTFISVDRTCYSQVLDGVGVGGTEKSEAKLKFVGKVHELRNHAIQMPLSLDRIGGI